MAKRSPAERRVRLEAEIEKIQLRIQEDTEKIREKKEQIEALKVEETMNVIEAYKVSPAELKRLLEQLKAQEQPDIEYETVNPD